MNGGSTDFRVAEITASCDASLTHHRGAILRWQRQNLEPDDLHPTIIRFTCYPASNAHAPTATLFIRQLAQTFCRLNYIASTPTLPLMGSDGRRSQFPHLPCLLCRRSALIRGSSPARALLAFPEAVVVGVLLPQEAGVRGEDMAARAKNRKYTGTNRQLLLSGSRNSKIKLPSL